MDDYTIKLDNQTNMYCTLQFFINVQNADELHKKIVNGELCCSILKAALIVDPFQVVVAANKAALNAKTNQLTTKSLFTEVVYGLSPTKTISRSLTQFGMNGNDKNIVVVFLYETEEEKSHLQTILDNIQGEKVHISKITEFADHKLVRKTYKILEDELSVSSLTDCIVSRISIKEFASL